MNVLGGLTKNVFECICILLLFWSIWVCPLFGLCVYGVLLYWRPPVQLQGLTVNPILRKKSTANKTKPNHLLLQPYNQVEPKLVIQTKTRKKEMKIYSTSGR